MTPVRVWWKARKGRRFRDRFNRDHPIPPIYRVPVTPLHGDPVPTPAGAGYPPTPHQPGTTEETSR